jgi:energy-coupling factor transporter ATP-binding protein EcfA2
MEEIEIATELPFVGLRSFRQDESHLFFGREKQIVELMEKLHHSRFIGVIGNSGCGKSSIIKAGLIPKLKAGFLSEERDIWITATFTPAHHPILNLIKAINNALSSDISIDEKKVIELGVSYVIDFLHNYLCGNRINLLILVDQFEELFTIEKTDEAQSNEDILFVNLILTISRSRECPIYVITTMRSEYIGKCNKFYGLPEMLNSGQYLIPRLNRQQIRQVIELPIKLLGYKISARLLDLLLNESDEKFDQLPVLQHCLLLTFLEWTKSADGDVIDIQHYYKIGKFKNALSLHADHLFFELNTAEQNVCVLLFKSLSAINYENEFIRRPQTIQQLKDVSAISVDFKNDELVAVLKTFSAEPATFLTISSKSYSDHDIVDISHESLLKNWHRLSEWIKQEATAARKLNWLANNVKEKRELLRGIDLKDALTWLREEHPSEAWAKRYHLKLPEIREYIEASDKKEKAYLFLKRFSYISALVIAFAIIFYAYYRIRSNQKLIAAYRDLQDTKAKAYVLNQTFVSFYVDSCSKDKKIKDLNHYEKLKRLQVRALTYFNENLGTKTNISPVEKAVYFDEYKTMNMSIHNFVKNNLLPYTDVHTQVFTLSMKEEAYRARQNVDMGMYQLKLDPYNIKFKRDLSARFGALSFRLLFTRQYNDAIKAGEAGLKINPFNDWIYTDIAEAYLLSGQFKPADSLIHQYGDKMFANNTRSFKDAFLTDFQTLELSGIIAPDNQPIYNEVQEIRSYLNDRGID